MEGRKTTLTPENYIKAIISLSKRYSNTSAFPGNNYVDIGEWLLQDRSLPNSTKLGDDAILFASKSEKAHDLVVVYNSGERKWDIQQYSQEQHESFSAATSVPTGCSGQIVFIRGFISPSWVSVIGSKYNIDPEFFRRHMDFLSASIDRHAFSFPSLSSSSNNIFRLCVSTLLHRDDFGGQDLQLQRSDQANELKTYKTQQLGSTRVCCGDSVVRDYSTVCSRFSVVEQWISLYISRTEKSWTVIAWMDQGRPLEKSPSGPWAGHIESNATPLPVLQHHHKMAFRTTTNRLDPGENASAQVQQSSAILPLQYDSLIALVGLAHRALQDPLSMCLPLYTHAAFSEVQFLNLMESRIEIEINSIAEGVRADILGTFQYYSSILDRHSQQLKHSIRALCILAERSYVSGAESVIPRSAMLQGMGGRRQSSEAETARSAGSSSSDGPFTANGLIEDYEQLHLRCIELSKKCTHGITLAMNKATIEESRKAIEQSQRLKKLTVLATLFIPLSFCSSLFGMNIDLLGQSTVKSWWFFVLCVPITLFAYILYLWDLRGLRQGLMKFWKHCGSFRRRRTAMSNQKNLGHIV